MEVINIEDLRRAREEIGRYAIWREDYRESIKTDHLFMEAIDQEEIDYHIERDKE